MPQLATQPPVGFPAPVRARVADLRSIALRALARMYVPERGLFAFRLRRSDGADHLDGVSLRYTAIALIGLATEDEGVLTTVLQGEPLREVCRRVLQGAEQVENIGDVALSLWAAKAVGDDGAWKAREHLLALRPWERTCPTVELAWSLTAFVVGPLPQDAEAKAAERIARRLIRSFEPASGLFPHWPADARSASLRSHIACYADLVYPIQALAHYHARTGDTDARNAATRCAARMCSLQGPEGQWWWHYDARNGRLVERYPVYSVHQDAMGPMALRDLQAACSVDHRGAIERGLQWLWHPPELDRTLIDFSAGVVWRKVARHEPGKLSRALQALASRVHPAFRVPGLGAVLRPGSVDYESRPYHFGWLLYAWSNRRLSP